ncbi:pH-sensitive chloride channel 2 [Musca domestica]|uniref:pH-sensitive chloride channel 2 n=1 Tax=Musca domestica TaxID=7370 RepID=A0A1I8MJ71_MUSDO|nr:pH-sensitive chloride channel 2 [Musca domestica]
MRKLIVLLVFVCCTNCAEPDCPTLLDADNLSQTQLLERLTHGCRYDRLERPITYSESGNRLPVDVYVRWYVYFMQNLEAHDLQFKIHALLQLRFLDPRLTFRKVAPKRKQPILGEKPLRDNLWVPHIFLANERDSSIMGTNEKDILTSISPDGTVIISSRIKATLYCWMNLQKFPFDEQHCSTYLESWMYNTSELILHWEQKRPITFDPDLHLTEYILQQAWSNETVINADLNDLRHGAFAGNYSSLGFTVHFTREVGFYIMDYFLPSMLIVGISWVSFWLQADQAPPRIMLGTSTMLTFITLASAQGKTLPKVSYIKVSEVWFLGCTLFIFGSLLEFAFVNTIWRRKQNVDVKSMSSRHILKSTLSPRLSRRKARSRSFSTGTLGTDSISLTGAPKFNNYLTVHNFPITTINENETEMDNVSKVTSFTTAPNSQKMDVGLLEDGNSSNGNNGESKNGWTTLTPQQISQWIDAKARVLFPMSFLVFNAFFWTFVYIF